MPNFAARNTMTLNERARCQTTPNEPYSATVATAIKMLEALPEPAQQQVVEHLRDYIAEALDDQQWQAGFAATQPQLAAAARRAREGIAREIRDEE